MDNLVIKPVRNRREREVFLTFRWKIYHHDPLWVPPLLPELRQRIDPQRSTWYKFGDAEFFIAWRENTHTHRHEPVGTICCAEDKAAHKAHTWKDAVIGFFECVADEQVAQALFNHASEWARQRFLDTLFGPFHLDYEDAYGVLVEGRTRPPAILCGHTPPYYQAFFENYGFEPARAQNLAFEIDVNLDTPQVQRMLRVAEKAQKRGNFQVRSANLVKWDEEISNVHHLLNRSQEHLPGFTPWQRETVEDLFMPFKDIADPELVLFVDTDEGETIGFLPGIPNLNEIFIHVNGLRYPWNYLPLFWKMMAIKRNPGKRHTHSLAIKSILVLPQYWETGAGIVLFAEMAKRASSKGYRWTDLSITTADNPHTPQLAEHMGAKVYKRYQVYRKWL
jgi:GNAT superfamily N-acetyltransferase